MSKPASTPPIKNSSIRSLKNKRGKLARKLAGEPTWVSGSFRQTTMYNKGYPDSGHPHQFISRRIDGRYKSTYVRKSQIEVAKRAVQRRRDIDTIINQVAEINIEVIMLEIIRFSKKLATPTA